MAWTHPTEYRHYLQLYPNESGAFFELDIEKTFKCRYVSLKNAQLPSVKSVYTESYGDHNGDRVWTSPEPLYNSTEMTLTLRWRSEECGDVQEWSEKFIEYISGRKFQYHDTFRPGKYWQFIFKDSPNIEQERLCGSQQYRFISFKLSNFGGKPTKESIL